VRWYNLTLQLPCDLLPCLFSRVLSLDSLIPFFCGCILDVFRVIGFKLAVVGGARASFSRASSRCRGRHVWGPIWRRNLRPPSGGDVGVPTLCPRASVSTHGVEGCKVVACSWDTRWRLELTISKIPLSWSALPSRSLDITADPGVTSSCNIVASRGSRPCVRKTGLYPVECDTLGLMASANSGNSSSQELWSASVGWAIIVLTVRFVLSLGFSCGQ